MKIISKRIPDLNVKPKTTKLLEGKNKKKKRKKTLVSED